MLKLVPWTMKRRGIARNETMPLTPTDSYQQSVKSASKTSHDRNYYYGYSGCFVRCVLINIMHRPLPSIEFQCTFGGLPGNNPFSERMLRVAVSIIAPNLEVYLVILDKNRCVTKD